MSGSENHVASNGGGNIRHGLNGKDAEDTRDWQILNSGDDNHLEAYGYHKCVVLTALTWTLIVATGGLLRLFFHWYPQLLLAATHRRCPLQSASRILIVERYQDKHKTYFIKDVKVLHATRSSSVPEINAKSKEKYLAAITNGETSKVKVWLADGTYKEVNSIRAITVKKQTYLWVDNPGGVGNGHFERLSGLEYLTYSELHKERWRGVGGADSTQRRQLYGDNAIEIKVVSFTVLALLELLNPFYIFQIFSIAVWLSENYYYYTVAIVLMSTFGIVSSVRQTRRNQKALHDAVTGSDVVSVLRSPGPKGSPSQDVYEDVATSALVPGDIIVVPSHGCTLQCDAALLSGTCIVNESMLTGESVPVMKTPLPKSPGVQYDIKHDSRHTLFCGTKVIQTRYYEDNKVLAVVLRTGYMTSKGGLVRSIMYPPPADFRFERDSFKFIGLLAIIALLGLIYTCIIKAGRGVSAGDVIQKALDLFTIVIPPALPAAMTVGKLCAQTRLASARIFCVNSRVINVAGSVDCICFDKTGTLTEDGMDLRLVVPAEEGKLTIPVKDPSKLSPRHPLVVALATCHSLTRIHGQLSGDPLDVKMFEATGWEFEEPEVPDTVKFDLLAPSIVRPRGDSIFNETSLALNASGDKKIPYEIGIVQQQQFSSTLQRMSVVTRTLGEPDFVLYCKGSPEIIVALSRPHTVPATLGEELADLTARGFRVLALGSRVLPEMSVARLAKASRAELETDLDFLGLLVMENRLKTETTPIIAELRAAHIKVAMVTGDNIQTAVSVARECGIVSPSETVVDVTVVPKDKDSPPELQYILSGIRRDSAAKPAANGVGDVESANAINTEYADCGDNYRLAITGSTWAAVREHYPDLVPRIASRGAVFARMTSDQKQQLVLELQALGYYVAMCGDGANDCGALRAAHVGISLSEAESSVAAPFTARDPHIGCVPRVIREGRAALCTSFGIFKFMVAYSLTEFASAIILYAMDSNLTDLQFLFIDICLILNFAFFFSKTDSFPGPLDPRPPPTTLLSLNPLTSMGSQVAINVALQAAAYHLVRQFPFYKPFEPTDTSDYACLENFSVYCVSMFQYIVMAIVYSQGAPYRKTIWSNYQFAISLAVMTAVCSYITLGDTQWINAALELVVPPDINFRGLLVLLAVVGFFVALIFERFIVEYIMAKRLRYWRHNVHKSRRRYLAIEHELRMSRPHWPPIEIPKCVPIALPPVTGTPKTTEGPQYDNEAFVAEDDMTTKF